MAACNASEPPNRHRPFEFGMPQRLYFAKYLPDVYCRLAAADEQSSAPSAHLHPIHTDIRLVSLLIRLHRNNVSACVDKVAGWTRANRLQLNPAKTIFFGVRLLGASIRSRKIRLASVNYLSYVVALTARPRGHNLYADVTKRGHIPATVRTCFDSSSDCSAFNAARRSSDSSFVVGQ